jgi:hypothetical protein
VDEQTVGAIVAAAPTRSFPDPYAAGAVFLALTLESAAELIPSMAISELDRLAQELGALRPFNSEA